MAKRCMTRLDDDALSAVEEYEKMENRNESQMIAQLVKEAIAIRRASVKQRQRVVPE